MDLKHKINTFPKTPGIYMMKDSEGKIIYIGKSKKLRDRVMSYFFNSSNHSRKIKRMVKGIRDIEIIQTDTELDALLLECDMIQKIKPIYNTLMKNHENYTYIKIDMSHDFPYLNVVKEIDDDSLYFGPYTIDRKLEDIKSILGESYKIRLCKNQTKCIKYDLDKCLGPCRGAITKEKYRESLDKVISTLKGEDREILNILENKMQCEISKLNFEKACEIKENIDLIKSLFSKQNIINTTNKKETILAWIKIDEFRYKIYLIKGGKLLNSKIINGDKLDKTNFEDLTKEMYGEFLEDEDNLITKSNIDKISIIHSYIKNSDNIKYIII